MKKTLLLLSICATSMYSNAQVGIATKSPQATLDVLGDNNSVTTADGVIAPRISKTELANKQANVYGVNQTGAIVYVNDSGNTSTGPSLAQVLNITSKGYYYFDGTKWQALSYDVNKEIWINNPTNDRVELAKTSKGEQRTNNQNIYVKDNGDLGLGTVTPSAKLHVNGNVKIETMDTYNADVSKPVYWNPETKSLSTTQVQRPFYNFKYKLRASVNEDWINDFNTKIDASKYTLIITSAVLKQSNLAGETFSNSNSNAYINLFDVDNTSDKASDLKQVLPNIVPFKSGNTWRIRVDFVNTAPYKKSPLEDSYFLWDIDVLVINNNSIYTIEDQFYKLETNTGVATKDPIPTAVTTP
ncbi:hypothetical protein [Faecalibacter rhinopitheci]|uniref:Uncharacterized protein n=1 Tax=Faecalibacter rhinopitheci TaxID=2779678 RepID=A0A8J7G8M8_9FLAO|nr:hypothetical protein [Faecalibacter rhinopitheci]MBF0597365.1 hypothetical protein [Faecalibacter rhinopitheci]